MFTTEVQEQINEQMTNCFRSYLIRFVQLVVLSLTRFG